MSSKQSRPAPFKSKPKSLQSRTLLFTIGGATCLVVGGVLALWFSQGQGKKAFLPLGAKLVPQDVMVSVTLSTDSGQWEKLAQFGTAASQKSFRQGLQNLETEILSPNGLNYKTHIQPWAGERLTMALLPPTPESVDSVVGQATLWVIPIRDQGQLQTVLKDKLFVSDNQAAKRTYKGVEINEFQAKNGEKYGLAVLDNQFAVLTTAGAPMDIVVNTFKGAPSLADVPRYSEVLKQIQVKGAFAQVYVNVPVAAAQLSRTPLSAESQARIQSFQGLGSTINLAGDGIELKSMTWLKPDAKPSLPNAKKVKSIGDRLPENTLMMASGGDFQAVWRDYAEGNLAKLILPLNPKDWNDFLSKQVGVDFNNQFVSWMDGEFTAALVPATKEGKGSGLVFLAQAKDRTTANQAFKALDDAVRDRFDLQVAESTINKQAVITWRVPPVPPASQFRTSCQLRGQM